MKSLCIILISDYSCNFSLFTLVSYMTIFTINLCLVFPFIDKSLMIFLFFDFFLLVLCFFIFFLIFKNKIDNETRVFRVCLDEISNGHAILKEIKPKKKRFLRKTENKNKNQEFELIFTNKKFLHETNYIERTKISFKDLDEKINDFEIYNIKSDHYYASEDKTLSPFGEIKDFGTSFENLQDILNFYNTRAQTPNLTIILKKKDKPDSRSHVKLRLKKKLINHQFYFIVSLKSTDKMKKIKEASEFKTRLLHSISHELKTPLNASLTFLGLLYEESTETIDHKENFIEKSLASLKLLENTLNNIIDYSLIISQEFIICMSHVNLAALLREIFVMTKSQLQLKNVNYAIELPGILSKKTIYTDSNRLKQIILNIVLNSIQFTNNGFIKVEVFIINRNPLVIEFSIKDSGNGMEDSFCGNLKEKIKNENSDFQANTTGSCMGLIISNKLAVLLGNEGLTIESKLNQGTTVSFKIHDQNFEIGTKTESKTSKKTMTDKIVIEDPKIPHIESIKDFSKKVELMKRRYKYLKKKNTILTSSFEDPIEESQANNYSYSMLSMTEALNNHNFSDITKTVFWKENYEERKKTNENTNNILKIDNKTECYKMKRTSLKNTQVHSHSATLRPELHLKNAIFFNEYENAQIEKEGNYEEEKSNPIVFTAQSVSYCESPHGNNKATKIDYKEIMDFKEFKECTCINEILIVDDDIFNLLSLELILKSFNIKSIKALNGKEALDLVTSKKCESVSCKGFPLIFMDYQMPLMDGVESTKEILKLFNNIENSNYMLNSKGPIIIGCTAFTTKHEVTNCLKAGMKDVIFKPVNKEIVGNILREWLP